MMLNMGASRCDHVATEGRLPSAKQRSTEHVVPKSAEEMFRLSARQSPSAMLWHFVIQGGMHVVSRRRRLQRRLPVGAVPSALLVASMPSSVIKLTNTHYRPPL